MLTGEHILCVTVSDWDGPRRGRHHIMQHLASQNQVIWVEKALYWPEITYTPLSRFFHFLKPPPEPVPGLRVLSPPPAFPLLDKIRGLDQINGFILLLWLKYKLWRLGFNPTILWCFSPYAHQLMGHWQDALNLYHCHDPFFELGYPRSEDEKKLCRKADLVFTVSPRLVDNRRQLNPRCFAIPQAVETIFLNQTHPDMPEDLKPLKKPLIGFVGVISSLIDLDLIEHLTDRHPEWSIVLVGPVHHLEMTPQERDRWARVARQNLFLLGGKKKAEVPAYLYSLDVVICPYRQVMAETYITIPLKFFECLAMGKPIVTTPYGGDYRGIPEDLYAWADTYEEFVAQIERALAEDNEERQQKRTAYAQQNSMSKRVNQMANYIKQVRKEKGGA